MPWTDFITAFLSRRFAAGMTGTSPVMTHPVEFVPAGQK
jgi:hypothetical protein